MSPLVILILAQLIFNVSDFMGRYFMTRNEFRVATFISAWFVTYTVIRIIASIMQLYVFKEFELGKVVTLAGVVGIVTTNTMGLLFLNETLSPIAYFGVAAAILAFILIAFS